MIPAGTLEKQTTMDIAADTHVMDGRVLTRAEMCGGDRVPVPGEKDTVFEVVYRKKNPRRVSSTAPDPMVSVRELCDRMKRGDNVHGYTMWAENGAAERIEVRFDAPTESILTAARFEELRSARAEENIRKHPWLSIRSKTRLLRGHPHSGGWHW